MKGVTNAKTRIAERAARVRLALGMHLQIAKLRAKANRKRVGASHVAGLSGFARSTVFKIHDSGPNTIEQWIALCECYGVDPLEMLKQALADVNIHDRIRDLIDPSPDG